MLLVAERTALRGFALVASLALAACSGDAAHPVETTGCAAQPIVGGSAEPSLLAGDAESLRALVAVLIHSGTEPVPDTCSGVVVAPRAVLTAAHCFGAGADGTSRDRAKHTEVSFGSPLEPRVRRVAVESLAVHPELDVALLRTAPFEEPASQCGGVAAIPPHLAEIDAGWVGESVELAGYGVSEAGGPGVLAFVVEPLTRLETSHLVVDGGGRTGACVGDSGGPLLGRTADGEVRVLGVLDYGDASCAGEDFYTRLDRLADWAPLFELFPR